MRDVCISYLLSVFKGLSLHQVPPSTNQELGTFVLGCLLTSPHIQFYVNCSLFCHEHYIFYGKTRDMKLSFKVPHGAAAVTIGHFEIDL